MKKVSSKTIRVGKKNNIFQRVVVLKENRYKRHKYNEFFVEGVHNIKSALKYGWKVKNWVYADRELSNWGKEMLSTVETERNYCFTEDLIAEISDRTDSSELMAIFEMKKMMVDPSKNPLIIICDRPSKKGNLGTIIRSADAFGCDGVIVTGHSVDIYDPTVIGATMGSFFAVKTEQISDNIEVQRRIEELRQKHPDLAVVATTGNGEHSVRDYDFTKPTILLVGNEGAGLSRFYIDICDTTIKIPMVGEATSLNVGNAASIFLYEIFSQRSGK